MIALFAPKSIPIEPLAAALKREEVVSTPFVLVPGSLVSVGKTPISIAVLVDREPGVVGVGERTNRIRQSLPEKTPLVVCTNRHTNADRSVLLKCGATDLISPAGWNVELVAERVLGELFIRGCTVTSDLEGMYGATKTIRNVQAHIRRLASLDEPVLILGESGTGKELVAKALHQAGRRRAAPYVPVNCPELTPELLGSELFGHVEGAFTSAVRARKGLLLEAGTGTVFLDEIGDLDLTSQAKLLRILEDGTLRPVGSDKFQRFTARMIFATNRNLKEACDEGKFRRDLLERLRGFTINIPPLRERKADIPLLVQHFLHQFETHYEKSLQVPPGALDHLFAYDWPGNVRELRGAVRKAAAYADNAGVISEVCFQEAVRYSDEAEVPTHTVSFNPAGENYEAFKLRAETIYFRSLLNEVNGNKTQAIQLSGLSRATFYEKLKTLKIDL